MTISNGLRSVQANDKRDPSQLGWLVMAMATNARPLDEQHVARNTSLQAPSSLLSRQSYQSTASRGFTSFMSVLLLMCSGRLRHTATKVGACKFEGIQQRGILHDSQLRSIQMCFGRLSGKRQSKSSRFARSSLKELSEHGHTVRPMEQPVSAMLARIHRGFHSTLYQNVSDSACMHVEPCAAYGDP